MTREDLEKMLPVIESIDGGCCSCVQDFCQEFNKLDFDLKLKFNQGDASKAWFVSIEEKET